MYSLLGRKEKKENIDIWIIINSRRKRKKRQKKTKSRFSSRDGSRRVFSICGDDSGRWYSAKSITISFGIETGWPWKHNTLQASGWNSRFLSMLKKGVFFFRKKTTPEVVPQLYTNGIWCSNYRRGRHKTGARRYTLLVKRRKTYIISRERERKGRERK